MIHLKKRFQSILCVCAIIVSCAEREESNTVVPSTVVFDETLYEFDAQGLPPPTAIQPDNLLTNQGVLLGKMLFFEPMLSKNSVQSCASCHDQATGFTDAARFSIGVDGLPGHRQAMSVFNMAWNGNEFFWDGRANLLRNQALMPIIDPLEMNETIDNVIMKLSNSQKYKDQFVRAFGSDDITSEKIGLAMEQFMLSIVSGNSKYDRFKLGIEELTESELRGLELFETEYNPFFPEFSGADCQHCHGGPNFENDQYMNNGLDTDEEITDLGREMVTGDPMDRAKFKVTTLRNIALTSPYMHDGRFSTLEEVIDHYNEGIKTSSTTDLALIATQSQGLLLTEQDKTDLINFLHTLTDESLATNQEYQNPH
ncbi:MAG: cytochrome-c peroxidase [Flavobacteriales bacterium]|nr:cytochrome-c peroxidase [Flavobacteriales bacterium]